MHDIHSPAVFDDSAGLRIFAKAPDRVTGEAFLTFKVDNVSMKVQTPWKLDDPVLNLANNGGAVTSFGGGSAGTFVFADSIDPPTSDDGFTEELNERITAVKLYWNPQDEPDWYLIKTLDINEGMV